MKKSSRIYLTSGGLMAIGVLLSFCGVYLQTPIAQTQGRQGPGRSIGAIRTQENLIVMTLDEGVLGKANLFDLVGRTLRFTPEGTGYRAENVALKWDPEFGAALTGAQVALRNFSFPYSGKNWESFSVGVTGSISFGAVQGSGGEGSAGISRGGGVVIDRFAQLQDASRSLINRVPAICVFFKPRMTGARYVKELADRVLLTWSLTEPVGGIQDFTWVPTVNRFQAVLWKDGTIELSYEQVAAKDAIVGLYPLVTTGSEKELAQISDEEESAAAAHLDLKGMKVTVVDGLFLKITLEMRGPVLPEGDPELVGLTYRIAFDKHKPPPTSGESARPDAIWTIRGFGRGGRSAGVPRYTATGPGVFPVVKTSGNSLSLQGMLPAAFRAGEQIAIIADVQTPGAPPLTADQIPPCIVTLAGIRSPEIDLSSVKTAGWPVRNDLRIVSLPGLAQSKGYDLHGHQGSGRQIRFSGVLLRLPSGQSGGGNTQHWPTGWRPRGRRGDRDRRDAKRTGELL